MRPTDERGRPMHGRPHARASDGDVIYIGASLGGLPAGEATPSRQSYADCGTGTPAASPVEPPSVVGL